MKKFQAPGNHVLDEFIKVISKYSLLTQLFSKLSVAMSINGKEV